MREPKRTKTENDLTKPIKITAATDGSCYGSEWDMSTNECAACADNIACGIVYNELVLKKKVKQMEDKHEGFLDQADFSLVTEEKLFDFIESGVTTAEQLMDYVAELSRCKDDDAVVRYLKRFIKSNDKVYTKNGIVWVR